MRNNIFLLLLLIASCGQPFERIVTKNVTFYIDTVVLDPGEDFIYMQDGASVISPEGDFLYHFNRQDHSLVKIDLEQVRMVSRVPFDKEGPDGTGDFVHSAHMVSDDKIYLNSNWTSGLFQLDGTRTASLNLYTNDLQGGLLQGNERLLSHIVSPDQPEVFFALVSDGSDDTVSLWKLDFGRDRVSRYDIDPERKFPNYAFHVPSLSKDPIVGPHVSLSVQNGRLIISSNLTNKIALYDPIGDSLLFKTNLHRVVSPEKIGNYNREYASVEELMLSYQKVAEDVNFLPPIWDKEKERYYRFSYLVEFKREKAAHALLPEISRLNLSVSILDENFDLLAEAPVPLSLTVVPQAFVRGGAIWLIQEIQEEPAFIRVNVEIDKG